MILKAPDFWQAGKRYAPLAVLLSPLSCVWRAAGVVRAAFAKPYVPSVPVICVGNITAGGTGKTPTALAIAAHFAGKRVCFLTRGFGGSLTGTELINHADDAARYGDEAIILSRSAPTIVSRDRKAGLKLAEAEGFELVIADDGLQNPHFAKTVALAVIDGGAGFGNGRVMPAGPLREPLSALKRLNAAIIVGDDVYNVAPTLPCPVLFGRLVADGLAPDLNRPYVAFAGIGRPNKFFATLKNAGYNVVETVSFGDHYSFKRDDMTALRALAKTHGAGLITTEKDFARLSLPARAGISMLRVHMVLDGDLSVLTPNGAKNAA